MKESGDEKGELGSILLEMTKEATEIGEIHPYGEQHLREKKRGSDFIKDKVTSTLLSIIRYSKILSLSLSFFFFCLFRATPTANGGSQARGQIGATAAGLGHSHSNTGSQQSLQPPPQLKAMPDPQPTERGKG